MHICIIYYYVSLPEINLLLLLQQSITLANVFDPVQCRHMVSQSHTILILCIFAIQSPDNWNTFSLNKSHTLKNNGMIVDELATQETKA